jgi:hypothetical protein
MLVLVLNFYSAVKKLLSDIWWVLGGLFHSMRRRAVKLRLEARLEAAGEEINREIPNLVPSTAVVKWVKPEDAKSALEDGKVLLFLTYDRKDEQHKEAAATYSYVKTALLAKSRSYVYPEVLEAIHLTVTNCVLSAKNPNAQSIFMEEILLPTIRADETLNALCRSLEEMTEIGLFHHVLIRELEEFPVLVNGSTPKLRHLDETRAFCSFLDGRMAQTVDGEFVGNWIKVSVLFIAKPGKYWAEGSGPYIRAISYAFDMACRKVYLTALGSENVYVTELIVDEAKSAGYTVRHLRRFTTTRSVKGICVLLERPGWLPRNVPMEEPLVDDVTETQDVPEEKNPHEKRPQE